MHLPLARTSGTHLFTDSGGYSRRSKSSERKIGATAKNRGQKGYATTGRQTLCSLLGQAVVFGIGHLYEGVVPVERIMLFGVLFGLLALWRKSLRSGMIAHTWSDIFGVILFSGIM
jgi:hypothetical protein